MDDAISRQAVLKLLSTIPPEEAMTKALLIQSVKQMDAAQPSGPDNLVKDSQGLAKDLVNDCISRKAAVDIVNKYKKSHMILWGKPMVGAASIVIELEELPPVQPELPDICVGDIISRQAAIDALDEIRHALWEIDIPSPTVPEYIEHHEQVQSVWKLLDKKQKELYAMPSAQPERTCVNCGRTANNGGWYADGGTRCPIEEHYALPKDGFCHLWEKRNVTDDDYTERREE